MASTPRTPRRGLPRVPGGEPWPPAASGVPGDDTDAGVQAGVADPVGARAEAASAASASRDTEQREGLGDDRTAPLGRQGLPRVRGGEPWPPAPATTPPVTSGDPAGATADASGSGEVVADGRAASDGLAASGARTASGVGPASGVPAAADSPGTAGSIRRGLPREPGGEPWPAADSALVEEANPEPRADPGASAADLASSARSSEIGDAPPAVGATAAATAPSPASPGLPAATGGPPAPRVPRPPLTVPRTVHPGAAASAPRATRAQPRRLGAYTPVQWLASAAVLGVFALALAGIVVLLARFVLALQPGQQFLAAFPGEYPLPEGAPVGLPAWLNWAHFLNSFFLLFIIRTGWQVRREKRPAAFWSPRRNKRRRISLALWFHQAIDILWVANGVIFVVLLLATGQWMRIVPTSWEVFPNALSAALQYAALDWPTENGWVNYNSLQQLSYFAITFVAAPLAIVSGVRLSGIWPKNAERLNRLYPVEWARRVHFPVMLFFVAFIVVHVGLVLATGALRNLDHMYAARGSVDPGEYTSDPTGLVIFAASLVVMAAAWVVARPAVLVPIARLFGDVKQR